MGIEKQPSLPYEKMVFWITKSIFDPLPAVFVRCEKELKPKRKPLGSNKLRADVFIEGLKIYPNGIGISVKGQDTGGTADRKIPHHFEYELPCYPVDLVIVVFLGDEWETEHGQEFVEYAYQQANLRGYLVFCSLDDFMKFCRDLADREKRAKGIGMHNAQMRLPMNWQK